MNIYTKLAFTSWIVTIVSVLVGMFFAKVKDDKISDIITVTAFILFVLSFAFDITLLLIIIWK